MKAARAEGVDIPGRLAVAGFSDSPMCELVTPELTSVEQPPTGWAWSPRACFST